MKITDFIPEGKENAIHLGELMEIIGRGPNVIKAMISESRKNDGAMILSGECGYWISNDENEIRAFVASMRKQAVSRFESIKAMEDSLNNKNSMNGQLGLFESVPNGKETERI